MIEKSWIWFDNGTELPLQEKIERAIKYYQEKYQKQVHKVYINASELIHVEPPVIDGVEIVSTNNVLLHHYYLVG